LVTSGTKVVDVSNSTLPIKFCSTADDYIWFATPDASITKTFWYVDASNKGSIGGAVTPGGNLFPDPQSPSVSVTTVCWNNQPYKVYVSNYQTSTQCVLGSNPNFCYIMELRNS